MSEEFKLSYWAVNIMAGDSPCIVNYGNTLFYSIGLGFIHQLIISLIGVAFFLSIVFAPYAQKLLAASDLCLKPFSKRVVVKEGGWGVGLKNILCSPIGLGLSALHFAFVIAWGVTIIGIPFAQQHFKLAQYLIAPFGKEIEDINSGSGGNENEQVGTLGAIEAGAPIKLAESTGEIPVAEEVKA